jgi:hypothetical protein
MRLAGRWECRGSKGRAEVVRAAADQLGAINSVERAHAKSCKERADGNEHKGAVG